MKIRDVAAEFSVFVYSRNIDAGASTKVALSQAGYDAYFFEDFEGMLSRLSQQPPHLIVFTTSSVPGGISEFVRKALTVNSEIRFIAVCSTKESETLAATNTLGLSDVVVDTHEGLLSRVVFSVDRVCEHLYLTYQTEQLLEDLKLERSKSGSQQNAFENAKAHAERLGPPLEERVRDYRSAASKEDLVRRFLQTAPKSSCVFLKYLPTVRSLVVTHANMFDPDRLQGVGCQLNAEEAKDFGTQVGLGMVPPSLKTLLNNGFHFPDPRLLPLFVQDRLEGIVAYDAGLSAADKMRWNDEFALMSLAYSHLALEKKIDTMDLVDPLTGVGNARAFETRISEELLRARRIRQPMSLVKIALDDEAELGQALGESVVENILKSLAQLIFKSGRTHDFVARTGPTEFSLLLPHSHRNGAMLRAERLRRAVESSQMLENGLKISASLGISEYPTLCSTAKELEESASKALAHIKEKGGNRLCLYKAPAHHQPEFAVQMDQGTSE